MKQFLIGVMCIIAVGCATNSQLPVQYGTMKLIEREIVSPQEVVEKVAEIRELVMIEGVTLIDLGGKVRREVGYYDMMPSDRLLVDAIIGDVGERIDIEVNIPIGVEHRQAVLDALDWVEQVARMY